MRLNEAPTGNFFVLGGKSRGIAISWLDRHSFLVGSTKHFFYSTECIPIQCCPTWLRLSGLFYC